MRGWWRIYKQARRRRVSEVESVRGFVRIEIVRYTDDHQPGFVECRLTDLDGRAWTFEEKAPVVCVDYLNSESQYPRAGSVGCTILDRYGAVVLVGVDALSDYFECRVSVAAITE